VTLKLKDICAIDWGNTSLTKKAYEIDGEYLAVSATGADGKISHYEHEDDVCVLSAIGAQCGKMFFPQQRFTAIKNTITLTPKRELVNSKYLYHLFTHIELPKRGAAQPFISKGDIEKFELPHLPPLEEQERIVAKLDAAFAEIDEAVKSTKQSKRLSSELIKAAILNKFESLPADCNIKFESVCSFVRGPFGGSLKKSIFVESGYAIYEQQHPINNQFENFRYYITEEKFSEMARFEVKPNDVLMSCSGVTLGRVGIVPKEAPKGIINQALLKITPKESLSSKYLQLLMRSDIFQNLIWGVSGGAAQPNVPPIKVIKNLILPIPSLQVQNELVNWANALQSLDVKNNLERKVQELSKLKSAILLKELQPSEAA
jgi:restriction endonuclease S subunit